MPLRRTSLFLPATRCIKSILLIALLTVFAGGAYAHAQGCSVVGAGATNAAGNSIPIWSCNPEDEGHRAYVPPPLPDVWGALAISTSLQWATVWNYKSEAAARAAALQRCKSISSVKDCKIAVAIADVCVSLALSKPQRLYAIGGPTGAVNFADMNANLRCQRAGGRACTIATSFCADGIRHIVRDPDAPSTPTPSGRTRR